MLVVVHTYYINGAHFHAFDGHEKFAVVEEDKWNVFVQATNVLKRGFWRDIVGLLMSDQQIPGLFLKQLGERFLGIDMLGAIGAPGVVKHADQTFRFRA